jgi:hypothetical protein
MFDVRPFLRGAVLAPGHRHIVVGHQRGVCSAFADRPLLVGAATLDDFADQLLALLPAWTTWLAQRNATPPPNAMEKSVFVGVGWADGVWLQWVMGGVVRHAGRVGWWLRGCGGGSR